MRDPPTHGSQEATRGVDIAPILLHLFPPLPPALSVGVCRAFSVLESLLKLRGDGGPRTMGGSVGGAADDDHGGWRDGERWRPGADVELAEPHEFEFVACEPLAHINRRVPGTGSDRVPDVLLQVSGACLMPVPFLCCERGAPSPVGRSTLSLAAAIVVVIVPQRRDRPLLHAQLLHVLRRTLLLLLLVWAPADPAHVRSKHVQLR